MCYVDLAMHKEQCEEQLSVAAESLFKFSVYLTFTIWAITVSYKEK